MFSYNTTMAIDFDNPMMQELSAHTHWVFRKQHKDSIDTA